MRDALASFHYSQVLDSLEVCSEPVHLGGRRRRYLLGRGSLRAQAGVDAGEERERAPRLLTHLRIE